MEWCQAVQLVQDEEKERIEKFRYRDDMISSLIGRLFLRGFAVSRLGLENREVRLGRTQHGKPVLEMEDSGWDYNVSHAGDWVVFAAGEARQLGLDVMRTSDSRVDRLENFFRIMNRQFTEQEWTVIRGDMEDEKTQLERFFRNWTLKESYVKAIGTGLNIDLRTLNFRIAEKLTSHDVVSSTELESGGEVLPWRFEESILDGDHVVCLAHNGDHDESDSQFQELDLTMIMGLFTSHCDIETQLLRPVDRKDYQVFSSKDHPKPF